MMVPADLLAALIGGSAAAAYLLWIIEREAKQTEAFRRQVIDRIQREMREEDEQRRIEGAKADLRYQLLYRQQIERLRPDRKKKLQRVNVDHATP